MFSTRLRWRALTGVVLGGVAMSMLASCDRGTLHDSLTYCNYLAAHLTEIAKVPATPADVDAEVRLFATLQAKAPVAVDTQWQQIAALVKEAATIDVNDAAARDKLTSDSYFAERSMQEISTHAGAVCGLVLPPVASVTPANPIPAPPSTAVPKATTPPKPAASTTTIDPNAPTLPPAETLPPDTQPSDTQPPDSQPPDGTTA